MFGFLALITAVLCRGTVLRALIQGVNVRGHKFAGPALQFVGAFPALTAITVGAGYTVLGAAWLYYKTESALRPLCARSLRVRHSYVILALCAVFVVALVQFIFPDTHDE